MNRLRGWPSSLPALLESCPGQCILLIIRTKLRVSSGCHQSGCSNLGVLHSLRPKCRSVAEELNFLRLCAVFAMLGYADTLLLFLWDEPSQPVANIWIRRRRRRAGTKREYSIKKFDQNRRVSTTTGNSFFWTLLASCFRMSMGKFYDVDTTDSVTSEVRAAGWALRCPRTRWGWVRWAPCFWVRT